MEPTMSKESIEAALQAQKERRPYFVTKFQGVIAMDEFKLIKHEEIWSAHYPEGYRYKTSYRLPAYL